MKKDWTESKAKVSILPGFQIVEVGYAAGTVQAAGTLMR
jgi:hypothetical protein